MHLIVEERLLDRNIICDSDGLEFLYYLERQYKSRLLYNNEIEQKEYSRHRLESEIYKL